VAATRRREAPPAAAWRRELLPAAAGIEGAAGVFLVARDGSLTWQLARAAVVTALTLAVVGLLRRRAGARARSGAALLAGLAGVTVGIGIGAAHLVKSGGWPVTVAGLAVLVPGVALLVAGSVGLVGAVRGWRRPLVAALVAAVALLVVMSTWPALYATNVPRPALGPRTPAAFGLDYENVRFPASDGPTLAGWYVPSRNGAAVAVLHGASSTRSATLRTGLLAPKKRSEICARLSSVRI